MDVQNTRYPPPPTSDNISFLPYPPPPQSGRHMCIGTNDLRNTENEHTIKNIIDIVDLCAKQGVNNILVSAITFREQFNGKVSTINNFLLHKQTLHNFTFIENNYITREHMWKDKIHLNTHGTINIAINFINALNKGLSD